MGFGGTSWKEEVLLHDGSTFIVKRSQSYSLNRLQSSTNSRIYQAAQTGLLRQLTGHLYGSKRELSNFDNPCLLCYKHAVSSLS
jgi:hypothetical protein